MTDAQNDNVSIQRGTKTAVPVDGQVVTRIAPSPTGSFHIGTARTALFNYLFAKQHHGKFIIRFEDTDQERSDVRYEQDILDALTWLGMQPDMVYRQSQRQDVYRTYIQRLLDSGTAYLSKEPAKHNPEQEVEVVRYRGGDRTVTFTDTIRGQIEVNTAELGDFVLARSVDEPLYNLAVVVDDLEMGVTHVLRGDDHISNTPRQIMLQKALGAEPPVYTHIPLIHSPSGGKLSKRKDAVSVTAFRDQGYAPEAMINALALLGWNPGDTKEVFTREELLAAFTLERIQKKEAVFNEKKLLWFHRTFMQSIPEEVLRREIVPEIVRRFPFRSYLNPRSIATIVAAMRERGALFAEERQAVRDGAYDFYFSVPLYPRRALLLGTGCENAEEVLRNLEQTRELLRTLKPYRQWGTENIRRALKDHAEQSGRSVVLWPLRVALSGREKSHDPFTIAAAIGKRKTMERLAAAIRLLREV